MEAIPTHTILRCCRCQRPGALAGIRLYLAGLAPEVYCPYCVPRWLESEYRREERDHQEWLASQPWMEDYDG